MKDEAVTGFSECPCCGAKKFTETDVLWKTLIKDWGLDGAEAAYTNKQQGYSCGNCGSSLRSMSLASAIMRCYEYKGLFKDFVRKNKRRLSVLEINEAGNLNQFLRIINKHILGSYPDINMENLPYKTESMDLVVHSDTLEHVKDPIKALSESYRVLKPGGYSCFTIPIIVGRLTRSRKGLKASYHGSPGNDEYMVMTEYGADMWTQVIRAGYRECRLYSMDYPASVVIIGVK